MYTPSILATPLVSSGPINSERPNEAQTFDWPFLDGDVQIGVWECTPGEFLFNRVGYSEVFTVLSGRATLHIDGGPSFELVPGAMILTPSGTTGRWVVHETVRKVYYSVND